MTHLTIPLTDAIRRELEGDWGPGWGALSATEDAAVTAYRAAKDQERECCECGATESAGGWSGMGNNRVMCLGCRLSNAENR